MVRLTTKQCASGLCKHRHGAPRGEGRRPQRYIEIAEEDTPKDRRVTELAEAMTTKIKGLQKGSNVVILYDRELLLNPRASFTINAQEVYFNDRLSPEERKRVLLSAIHILQTVDSRNLKVYDVSQLTYAT